MARQSHVPVAQLAHPLRVAVAQPTLVEDMGRFLGPVTWNALKEGLSDDNRHTGEILEMLFKSGEHRALRQYLEFTGFMPAGTEMGNAFAGLLGLRHALWPQPFFVLDDDLAALLEHTDIAEDIPLSMLQLPYPRFYIEFGRNRQLSLQLPNTLTGMHTLEGAYVETGARGILGAGTYVMLTASPLGKSGPLDDATQSVYLSREDPDMTLFEALKLSFDKSTEFANQAALQTSPDSFLRPSFESLLYLAKALLYLGLPEARRTTHPERSAWRQAHQGLKSPAKRVKAERQGARLVDHVLVAAPPVAEPVVAEDGKGGRTVVPHWRRGHYRLQAHGPRHAERKLIFVRPVLVNAGYQASPSAGSRHYDVR